MNLPILDIRDVVSLHPEHLTVVQAYQNPYLKVVWFGFCANQRLADHHTSSHALIQTLSGRVTVHADGQTMDLGAGAIIALDPGVVHSVTAVEDSVVQLILSPHPEYHSLLAKELDTSEKAPK